MNALISIALWFFLLTLGMVLKRITLFVLYEQFKIKLNKN